MTPSAAMLRITAPFLMLAVLLASPRVRAAEDVSLFLDWVPGGFAAAWYDGIDQGCFAREGINLTVSRGYGGVDTVTKVATNVANFGIADLGSIMAGRIRSAAPVRAIMPIYSDSPLAVAVLSGGPIKTLKDIEGRKLGAAPGDSSIVLLPVAMAQAGADFTKIQKTSAEPAALTGLLLQGSVDAVTTYMTSGQSIVEAGRSIGKPVTLINFGRDLGIYSNSLFTSDALLAKSPDLVKRMRAGSVCAFDGAHAHVERAMDALVAHVAGTDRATQTPVAAVALALAFDSRAYAKVGFGWDSEQLARTLTLVLAAQDLKSDLPPGAFVAAP